MTDQAVDQTFVAPSRKWRISNRKLREWIEGYIWTSPWWLGFLVFGFYPMLAGLYYAFTDARWVGKCNWVGLQNFVYALTEDRLFWPAIGKTLYYSFAVVPLGLAASLFAANILNQKLKGENFLRTFFYIPSLMPSVALVVIWTWILNPTYGLLNQFLGFIGIDGPGWLSDPTWAIPALILMAIWGSFGGVSMLIFLSAMQSIPQELYEVCELDGGNALHKFRHVTVPMISPAIMFNLIMGIISSFQSFLFMFLAPAVPGGPNYATYTLGLHIYNLGCQDGRMGLASAMAWLLFLVVLAIVLINYKLSGSWIFMTAMQEEGGR
jgi:multiple sugar transport system permease protein